MPGQPNLDALIFGGGVAGLWALDELVRRGDRVLLLEADALGNGQTITSQGIIHGGLKYTLDGLLHRAAGAIREMPLLWRECLSGQREPDLSATRLRADFCHLWRTESLSSKLAMIGARVGLRVAPQILAASDRPAVLAHCPGAVARLEEQVIDPVSLLVSLASRHQQHILKINWPHGVRIHRLAPGHVEHITIMNPANGAALELRPSSVILAAGAGNAALREEIGLSPGAMQRRPLHMVMIRASPDSLPILNGHCVDGARTRLTITTDRDSAGRTIWQLGGQIAEDGVAMNTPRLIAHAKRELADIIPGINLERADWCTDRVDRAEAATPGGARPADAHARLEGNTITAWPTKLALAPVLAARVARLAGTKSLTAARDDGLFNDWPRPAIALPPWEVPRPWSIDV